MANTMTVDNYFAALPDDRRAALDRVRALLFEAVPDAQEAIAYQMPSYRVGRRYAFSLSNSKQHMSLHVWATNLIDPYVPRLGKVKAAGGTIRFKRPEDLNLDVLRELVLDVAARFRAM